MNEDRYTREGNAIFDRGKRIILLDREWEWKLLEPICAEANRAEKLEAALRKASGLRRFQYDHVDEFIDAMFEIIDTALERT